MIGPDAMSEERSEECCIAESWTFRDSVEHVHNACIYERCSWDEDPGSSGFLAYVEDHAEVGITALVNLRDDLEALLDVVNRALNNQG